MPIPVVVDIIRRGIEGREGNEIIYRVLEYGETVSKCDPEPAREIMKMLLERGLKSVSATQIVNIAPRDIDLLKILLYFEERMPDQETLEEIIRIIDEKCSTMSRR